MRSLKLLLLASTAGLVSTGAFAADLLAEPPPIQEQVVDNGYSWDGPYFGLFLQGQSMPNAFGLGANLGVNALMNGVLIGGEFEVSGSTNNQFEAQLTGKLGAALGDSAIIYAYSGAGSRTTTSWYVPVGIGAELRVSENIGIKAEAQYNFDLTSTAENSAAVKAGLVFHF